MIHISIEGLDGVGKTTICRLLAKMTGYTFVEKPLHYLFDVSHDEWPNYFHIRNKVNMSKNRDFTAWFYGLGNIYLYEKFRNKNIITDRHLASNYCWSGTSANEDIYDLLIKKINVPSLTVVLYAKQKVIENRLINRDKKDKDLKKIRLSEKFYEKMIHFCEMRRMPYMVIDTTNRTPKEIVATIVRKVEEQHANHQ